VVMLPGVLLYGKGSRVQVTVSLLVLILTGTTGSTLAMVRDVPESYPTIQAAIDASVPGDTVLLSPGTYRGPGNRQIELRG
jgi:hypothetical protein